MRDIRRIVVPVDFAYHTEELVEYAAYLAGELSAVIQLLHVVEFYPGNSMIALPYIQQYEEKVLADVRTHMANLLEDNRERCRGCTGEVVIGDPVEKIVEFAKDQDSELIIMSGTLLILLPLKISI